MVNIFKILLIKNTFIKRLILYIMFLVFYYVYGCVDLLKLINCKKKLKLVLEVSVFFIWFCYIKIIGYWSDYDDICGWNEVLIVSYFCLNVCDVIKSFFL